MSGKWTTSLPEVMSHDDPRIYGEKALRNIVLALEQERGRDMAWLLAYVRHAAANVRVWRLSLPKDQQSERVEDGGEFYNTRDLLGRAIHNIVEADGDDDSGHWLRYAEADLRTIGKRLLKESK